MDYYERRKQAVQYIDRLYKSGCDVGTIRLNVEQIYGFGKRVVEDRVNLLDSEIMRKEKK